MKRILLVTTLGEAGGAQRYVADLALALLKQGYQVFVAIGENREWLYNRLVLAGFSPENIFSLKHLVREIRLNQDLLAIFEISRLIKKLDPDLVHLNSSKAGVLGSISAKLCSKKTVYTAHGWVFNEILPRWKKSFYLLAEIIAGWFRDKVIVVSNNDYETALSKKVIAKAKLVKINNGLDPALASNILNKEEAKNKLGEILNTDLNNFKIVGTIANFYPTKGLAYFVKMAEQASHSKNDVKFVIIGFGQEEQKIRNLISSLNLDGKVFLTGELTDGYRYLKAFDIFCLTSLKEGFPYVLLEALLAQVYVVATNVGGVPEIIDQPTMGSLVPSASSQALADKIIERLFVTQSQEQINFKFTLAKMVSETIKVYG